MNDEGTGWTEHRVGRHTCQVFLPSRPQPHGYVLLYLHDTEAVELQGQAAFESEFERHGLTVIAPQAGRCWWSDRLTPAFDSEMSAEQFLRVDILAWIEKQFSATPPQIGLWGWGMGGQGALRLAYKRPNEFPVVAAIAPDLDYQYRILEGDEVLYALYGDVESARQDTALLHIHPLNWPRHQFFCCDPDDFQLFEGADRLRMKLGSIGVPFESDLETRSVGGRSYATTMAAKAIGYLVDSLDRERLRVM